MVYSKPFNLFSGEISHKGTKYMKLNHFAIVLPEKKPFNAFSVIAMYICG
jgi:hypothetical protein